MRVAIVHEWLTNYAGSERVLEQMIKCFPQADLFSLVDHIEVGNRQFLGGKESQSTFIQHLPFSKKHFRNYLSLFPLAVQQLDLTGYDLVLSSSHCVAKGVVTNPDQMHICMCYSPVRYAWDLQHEYLNERGIRRGIRSAIARMILYRLRLWDTSSSNGVDEFIAISNFVSRRIKKAYRRTSTIIYPPVAVDDFPFNVDKEDFYLAASRQVPYKRIPLIVEAFRNMPNRKLVVIGDGPDSAAVTKAAAGVENVKIMGYQEFDVLRDYMSRAKGFVFAALEDFGIIPLEAQACGTPVIAYGKGGAFETISGLEAENPTGVLFNEQSVESIVAAIELFESNRDLISPDACRENAQKYAPERFRTEFTDLVKRILK